MRASEEKYVSAEEWLEPSPQWRGGHVRLNSRVLEVTWVKACETTQTKDPVLVADSVTSSLR